MAEIKDFNAAKEAKAAGQPFQPAEKGSEPPEPRLFEVFLNDNTLVMETGFLVPTSNFIGIGDTEGYIDAVYPLEQVHYISRVKNDAEAAA